MLITFGSSAHSCMILQSENAMVTSVPTDEPPVTELFSNKMVERPSEPACAADIMPQLPPPMTR